MKVKQKIEGRKVIKGIVFKIVIAINILIIAVFLLEYFKDNPQTIYDKVIGDKGDAKVNTSVAPREGEKLSYLVKYLWIIPVAVAEIEVGKKESYKNHNVYPLVAKARVHKFVSSFIEAEGTIKSYVDVDKLYPWRYEENSHAKGHRPSEKIIYYHQDNQIMELKDIKRKIPPNTQDPLSALFYLRWQNYEKNSELTLDVNSNKENYTLYTKIQRKENINTPKGKKELMILESHIRSHKEYSKSEAKLRTYVTDDNARIPILLKVSTKFGPLIIKLIDVKNE